MNVLRQAAILLGAQVLSCYHHHYASAVVVGDEVCITGYIMDNFCIFDNGGVLLDNRTVTTLKNPEWHSYHCLLDVGICSNSGYQVLGEKDPITNLHCLGFRLDDTEAVLAAGRGKGKKGDSCTTCTGTMDSDPEYGYRATVKGTVKELGDGTTDLVTSTPVLTNIQLLDDSVECGDEATVPPLCAYSDPSTSNEPTLAPISPANGDEPSADQSTSNEPTLAPISPANEDEPSAALAVSSFINVVVFSVVVPVAFVVPGILW